MRLFLCISILCSFSKINAQYGWSYFAVDSTSPLLDRVFSIPYSIGFNGFANTAGGVFFAGTMKDAGGHYNVNFWDTFTSLWGDAGSLQANDMIYNIATNNAISPSVFVTGEFTDPQGNHYVASKRPLAGWDELSTNLNFGPDSHFQVTTNGHDTYAAGFFRRMIVKIRNGQPDTTYHGYTYARLNGSEWEDIGDSVIPYTARPGTTAMATNFAGNLFVSFGSGFITDTIYTYEYNGGQWQQMGNSFASSNPYGGATSLAVSSVGSDLYLAGSFTDDAGNYYVAHLRPSSNSWEKLGSFTPNGLVHSLVFDMGNLYAAGEFTDSTHNPYVAKYTSPGDWFKLGGPMMPSAQIMSLTSGGRYLDDIYASGPFIGKRNQFYYLAHFNNNNCLSASLGASARAISLGTPVIFTVNETNGGSNPLFTWKKNDIVLPREITGHYTDAALINGDKITAIVTGNSDCSNAPVADSIIMSVSAALPLTLLDFQADLQQAAIECTWKTTSEVNVKYFNLQRSTDGLNFINLSAIPATGTVSSINNYRYNDVGYKNAGAKLYYRLQTVNLDGSFQQSAVVAVDISVSNPGLKVFPNPSRGQFQVSGSDLTTLQIFNITGLIIISRQINSPLTTSGTFTLSPGMYFIHAVDKIGHVYDKKIIVY